MTDAREEVLRRIATAHRSAPPPSLSYEDIQRDYRRGDEDDRDLDQLIERLVDRLRDYKALVRQVELPQLPSAVATALAERGVDRLVVPDGLDDDWLAEVSIERLADGPTSILSVDQLDGAGGVITGCAVAIAETGTIVLDAGPGQGRRALTLVPDYHLCVVHAEALCADVPQAITRLDLTRPITMISGPSATSDIELTRVEGVHGPRTLEVIIVGRR